MLWYRKELLLFTVELSHLPKHAFAIIIHICCQHAVMHYQIFVVFSGINLVSVPYGIVTRN